MPNPNYAINQIFTVKVIDELISNHNCEVYDYIVQKTIDKPFAKTNEEIIRELYAVIKQRGRNEYYYKNTLLNKLLLGKYSVNTATALAELRIAKHIADFVMINGEGYVFEIKSDLDNLMRIKGQLYDYYKAFGKVSLLVPEKDKEKVEKELCQLNEIKDYVGVYTMTPHDTILDKKKIKEPIFYSDMLDHYSMFSILKTSEYTKLICDYYGEIPNVAPVFLFKTCFSLFQRIPVDDAHKLMLKALKGRNRINKDLFDIVPMELKSVVYFSKISKCIPELNQFLSDTYGG